MGVLNRLRQFFLRDVLDLFVEREHDARAGVRSLVGRVVPAAVRIGQDQHFARLAANGVVERVLDSSQPFLVDVHVTQHVRGEFAFRIEPSAFPLEINPAQIHRGNAVRFFRRQFSRNPRKGMRAGNPRGDFVGGNVQHFADQARHHIGVGNFRGHGEGRIHGNAHRQRIHVAVKNFGAARADIHDEPLLVLRAGIIFAVAEQLQVGQPSEHRPGPYRREGSYNHDPGPGTAKIHIFAGNSGPNSREARARPSGRAAPVYLSDRFKPGAAGCTAAIRSFIAALPERLPGAPPP